MSLPLRTLITFALVAVGWALLWWGLIAYFADP